MASGWVHVGQVVGRERGKRWPRRGDFAKDAGLSRRTIEEIERGKRDSYKPGTLARIESALQWEPGTIEDRLLIGLDPLPNSPELREIIDMWPDLPDLARVAILAAARSLHSK